MTAIALSEGRLLSAKQYARRARELADQSRASSEADEILAQARGAAAEIIKQAEAQAAESERKLREVSDEQLNRFLNEDAVDLTARALANLLEQARQIRADLDQAQTWVVPLVRTALKRIIGTMPEDDVIAGSIAQSLAEVRDRWDLVLRCHPALQKQLSTIVAEDSRLKDAIREVQVDRALTVDECRLVSGQGVLDIGVNTQIETFLHAVEKYLIEDADA